MTLELVSPPLPELLPVAAPEDDGPPGGVARMATVLIVGIPFVALVFGVVRLWGRGINLRDVLLALAFYVLVGHGISIGFHRLLAHRSFTACRTAQVGARRPRLDGLRGRTDRLGGQPPAPPRLRRHGRRSALPAPSRRRHRGQLKGLWHAHLGWLFTARSASRRHAADLLADRDIVVMDALFPMWCVLSLAVPFGLGWLLGGTLGAAISACSGPGLVRVCVLHHATWSINSLCHMFGRRPFVTKDRSGNVAPCRHQHGRVVAQRAPRLSTLSPSRPAARPMGHLGIAHPGLRAVGVGSTTCTGRRRGHPQCRAVNDEQPQGP